MNIARMAFEDLPLRWKNDNGSDSFREISIACEEGEIAGLLRQQSFENVLMPVLRQTKRHEEKVAPRLSWEIG
jgi:hypothetical protein